MTTLAGSYLGFADGQGSDAKLYAPTGIRPGPGGVLLVADDDNRRLRAVTLSGLVSTLAGSGSYGDDDGPAPTAKFGGPVAVVQVSDAELWIADSGNNAVRTFTAGTVVCGDPADPCSSEVCEALSGVCVLDAPPVGKACDDGDPCTSASACQASGACGGGQPLGCDDGEPCTADACDPSYGCTHTPTGAQGCGPVAVFSDDFEAGAAAWTIAQPGSEQAVGWQVVAFTAPTWSQSPSSALYYGQLSAPGVPEAYPGDTSGAARSKPILVPAGAPKLTFALYADVEASSSWDRIEWWAVETKNNAQTKLWDKSAAGFAVQVWKTHNVDLSAFVGKAIHVEVRFDSVDASNNTGKGVFIDDVSVSDG